MAGPSPLAADPGGLPGAARSRSTTSSCLFAFAPVVKFLVSGAAGLEVPFSLLLESVLIFVVNPLALGSVSRAVLLRGQGAAWFEGRFLPALQPVTVLATLVAIFAFQTEKITTRALHVVLIAVPILLQVYFNSSLTYGLMRFLRVPYSVAAPGALIGASNFFELAVATAIAPAPARPLPPSWASWSRCR